MPQVPNPPGFPAFELPFDRDAQPVHPTDPHDLLTFATQHGLTDLLVLAHGWNNNMADARGWYLELLGLTRQALDGSATPVAREVAARRLGVVLVFWPSKRFTDADLIPGGVASADDFDRRALLDLLRAWQDGEGERAEARQAASEMLTLSADLDSPEHQEAFVRAARRLLGHEDPVRDEEDGTPELLEETGPTVMERLSLPVLSLPSPDEGGATSLGTTHVPTQEEGGAAGLMSFFGGGLLNGARNVLNLVTYYEMKDRAGRIGADGLAPLLRSLRQHQPELRVHLIGHSFGARLVTAATNALASEPEAHPDLLVLLQAAFSHYGLATNYRESGKNGVFQAVAATPAVRGPVLITHTPNDMAVGLAYPAASLLRQQQAAFIGGPNDPFGGIGRNGAQDTPGATFEPLPDETGTSTLRPGKVHNFESSAFIKGHSAVCTLEVSHLVLSGIAATGRG